MGEQSIPEGSGSPGYLSHRPHGAGCVEEVFGVAYVVPCKTPLSVYSDVSVLQVNGYSIVCTMFCLGVTAAIIFSSRCVASHQSEQGVGNHECPTKLCQNYLSL